MKSTLDRYLDTNYQTSAIAHSLIRSLYMTANPFFTFELSEQQEQNTKELKENGLTMVYSDRTREAAEYFSSHFFENVDGEILQIPKDRNLTERYRKGGVLYREKIPFKNHDNHKYIFDPDLLAPIQGYYSRQMYFRNHPVLMNHTFQKIDNEIDIQGKFHLDHFHQTTVMLLLNDLDENDTHMQLALKSHKKREWNYDRFSYSDESVLERFKIKNLIGPKGTAYIFDAGGCYHRASYKENSTRKILHMIFTTGYNIVESDKEEINSLLKQIDCPNFIKKSLTKIAKVWH